MEVTRLRALRGPNVWSRHTVLEVVVRLDPDEQSIQNLPGLEARLRARFPGLGAIRPPGQSAPASVAHVLELATLHLQAMAGCAVTFSAETPTRDPAVRRLVVEYTEEAVGRLAFELSCALYTATLQDTAFDLESAVERLRSLDEDVRLGPSTAAIVEAAAARGIPSHRLTSGSLIQLGWGSRQRRIQAAENDRSSAIAEAIAKDKWLCKGLLAAAGIPVPRGSTVTTAAEAWSAARALGGPVVVKPRGGNQGKGVTSNISTRTEVETAFEVARSHEPDVLVEAFVPGDDHRLLVVGDRVVAAARRDPPSVVGNGRLSVGELVARVNEDPRRGVGHGTPMTRIRLDDIALAHLQSQGWRPDDVPAKGTRVTLRHNANLSTGGSATDVTDDVHPELAARAIEAARMVGLDICGVDVVCKTVRQPLEIQGGAIVEVNAAPGLRMHLQPSYGRGRSVGDAIVGTVFGPGEDGGIPVVAVTGVNGKTTTVRLTAAMFAASGLRVGMTNTDGVFVDGRQIDSGDCSGPRSARSVLLHPDADAAVLETARGGILREGLGFDRCSVAVVTNIGTGDHLGLDHIDRVADLAAVKQVIVANVAPTGAAVLNAADPLVAAMARTCPGEVILFAADPMLPGMAEHRARGGRCVHVADGRVSAVAGHAVSWRMPLGAIPVTRGGILGFQVQNVLAATAAAWAAAVPWTAIETALADFDATPSSVPGRFNEFHIGGATVFADYGHNPDALAALVQGLDGMAATRRSIVISAAGDRRDEDIVAQGRIVGAAFDRVLLYQDAAQRGRADGEVMALLRQGLRDAARVSEIEEIHGEFVAIDRALDHVRPGEICLILIDQVAEALTHLAARADEWRARRGGSGS